ncbi:MAG: FtsX-like permease family protein [Fuerstiella sp.]
MIRRPGPSITALIVVAMGVSALVAAESIASSSERQIAGQMQQLGANILVLPNDVSLQDYYAADTHGQSIPEEYVSRITLAQMTGVEELSPKLTIDSQWNSDPIVLTGILPRTEFYQKSSWQSVSILSAELAPVPVGKKCEGCNGRSCQISSGEKTQLSSYSSTRIIHELDKDALLIGADLAEAYGIQAGDKIELSSEMSSGEPSRASLTVAGILPTTGTTDDNRMFAHLHTVQELHGEGPVVNVIEVMGCCEDVSSGLADELDSLLPGVRVVTISQVVEAQVTVNRVMNRLSWVLFALLMAISGASIASVMFANVTERKRELGTMLALGATPTMVGRMIILKASAIGLVGGIAGLAVGVIAAFAIGGQYQSLSVGIQPQAALVGVVVAILVAAIASFLPARKAAQLDPCVCLQEL